MMGRYQRLPIAAAKSSSSVLFIQQQFTTSQDGSYWEVKSLQHTCRVGTPVIRQHYEQAVCEGGEQGQTGSHHQGKNKGGKKSIEMKLKHKEWESRRTLMCSMVSRVQ